MTPTTNSFSTQRHPLAQPSSGFKKPQGLAQPPVQETESNPSCFDLVPNQRQFWEDLMEKLQCPALNVGSLVKIPAALDMTLFFKAYQATLAIHDGLSMVLVRDAVGKTVRQRQHHATPVIEFNDCSDQADPYLWATRDAGKLADAPLNPFVGPLYRAKIYNLGAAGTAWAFVCHHMVCDGWSMVMFVTDVVRTYRGYLEGRNDQVARPSFADWAREGVFPKAKKSDEHWRQRLADTGESLFGQPLSQTRSKRRAWRYTWSEAQTQQLVSFCSQEKNQAARVVQGLLGATLAHYFGKRDWVMALPTSNRVNRKQKAMSGQFSSSRPFPWRYEPNLSLTELLAQIGRDLFSDYRAGGCDMAELSNKLGLRQGGKQPMYDVSFNVLSANDFDFEFDGQKATIAYLPFQHYVHPLEVAFIETDGGAFLSMVFNYDPNVVSEADIRRINTCLMTLLARATNDSTCSLADLLADGNSQTTSPAAKERCG